MVQRPVWIVLACGAATVAIAMGVRQSFGIFLRPISMDLEVGRQVFGFAIALQNLLFGLAQPFVGAIADRMGAGRVMLFGTLLYMAGLALTTLSNDPLALNVTLGVLVGLALSGTTYVVVLGAVGRVVSPERRSVAFGIVTAAGSFGMFAVVPGAQALLTGMGWQGAFLVMAVAVGAIALLGLGLAGAPSDSASDGPAQSLTDALKEAGGHSGYWLLNAGFFVCGFHIAFVATHLPAFLGDNDLSPAVGANALALIGFFNIIGSYLFGMLGNRYRKKYLLSGVYFARSAVIGLFLILPLTPATALMFGAGIGFLWLATIPLTSGLVAQMFGTRYLSTLYGIVFLSHQIGSFLGAWLGGVDYDLTGTYDTIWMVSILLGIAAGLVNLPIADQPAARLQRRTA
ncbi:MFS transporter [Inquilinus sp. CAU 1745]|uniref:MFS transporter n=1 Tax=Inquilinus sp. CAU 1745 TaxID=3140369 RepID=UPI00325C05AC